MGTWFLWPMLLYYIGVLANIFWFESGKSRIRFDGVKPTVLKIATPRMPPLFIFLFFLFVYLLFCVWEPEVRSLRFFFLLCIREEVRESESRVPVGKRVGEEFVQRSSHFISHPWIWIWIWIWELSRGSVWSMAKLFGTINWMPSNRTSFSLLRL